MFKIRTRKKNNPLSQKGMQLYNKQGLTLLKDKNPLGIKIRISSQAKSNFKKMVL